MQSDDFVRWQGDPEREFFDDLLAEDIAAAIDTVRDAFRLTISLANVAGRNTYERPAEVLGVTLGTYHSRKNGVAC
ncbi:MAG: hypothetical protein WAM94_09090 [Chromatiaceae bacterium]